MTDDSNALLDRLVRDATFRARFEEDRPLVLSEFQALSPDQHAAFLELSVDSVMTSAAALEQVTRHIGKSAKMV